MAPRKIGKVEKPTWVFSGTIAETVALGFPSVSTAISPFFVKQASGWETALRSFSYRNWEES